MTGVMWLSGTRTIQWQELALVMCSQTVCWTARCQFSSNSGAGHFLYQSLNRLFTKSLLKAYCLL